MHKGNLCDGVISGPAEYGRACLKLLFWIITSVKSVRLPRLSGSVPVRLLYLRLMICTGNMCQVQALTLRVCDTARTGVNILSSTGKCSWSFAFL